MKELTAAFNNLLQDKRVQSEQSKYETIQRHRSTVINKYKRAYQEFLDLEAGLQSAKNWYTEMRETVESLEKNVETFVNNRRSEGAQLLSQIEQERASGKNSQAEMERERMRELMERMSMEPAKSSPQPTANRPSPTPLLQTGQAPRYPPTNFQGQYQVPSSPPPHQQTMQQQTYQGFQGQQTTQSFSPPPISTFAQPAYNPSQYGRTPGPTSPPPNQTSFGMNAMRGPASPPPNQTSFGMNAMRGPASPPATQTSFGLGQQRQSYNSFGAQQPQQHTQGGYVPPGFVPPPPPPGPPPLGPQQTIHYGNQEFDPNSGHPQSAQQQQHDPWAGLNAWK